MPKKDKPTANIDSGNLDVLQKISTKINNEIYGTDKEFETENDDDLLQIRNSISKIREKYKNTTGENIIEFLNRFFYEKNTDEMSGVFDKNNGLVNLNKLIEDPMNSSMVNDLFFLEMDRISLYENYNIIYEYIPQIAQALDTYVDTIMSPDDFTKNVLNIFYNNQPVNTVLDSDVDHSEIFKNLKELTTKYKIEDKATEIITNTLKNGNEFVAVLKINKEIEEILNESQSGDLFKYSNTKILTKEDLDFSDSDFELLKESNIFQLNTNTNSDDNNGKTQYDKFISENSSNGTINEKKQSNEKELYIEKFLNMINENIKLVDAEEVFLTESINLSRDFMSELNKRNKDDKSKSNDKNIKLNLNGSIIKILEPEKTIKLAVDDVVYGYYYIEKAQGIEFGSQLSLDKQTIFSPTGSQLNGIENKNLKVDMIVDLFIKNISKKIDKKFVMKNKDFKYLIYNLLHQGYIFDKQIKITYLNPDEVIDFKVFNEKEYGKSLFRKILFTAKLYLAVLLSSLMSKIIRSWDQRVYYIEVGLDNDVEGAVQSFVRDLKNKEIKMTDMKDINTTLKAIGKFHDLYMPIINGEKPVEIDTLQGMDQHTPEGDEFFQFLLKAMLSGMGVPASFLQYMDEVEFARTLAMQNAKFVRAVIHFQKKFGNCFSELYRTLYRNEYTIKDNTDNNSNKETTKENIAYELIEVKFPPPSSLNMTNLQEQINNSRDIIDFITATFIGDSPDDGLKQFVRKDITTNLIPSIDWDLFENIVEKAKIKFTKEKYKKEDPLAERDTSLDDSSNNLNDTTDNSDTDNSDNLDTEGI